MQRTLSSLLGLPSLERLGERVDQLVAGFVQPPHDPAHFSLAENLLRDLFRHRRLQPGAGRCATEPCPQCLALHLPRVHAAIQAGLPVQLVLPAFPAKSANLRKVTGPLPDFGEELALRFLQDRCAAIQARYPPGARLTICSDGRVFSDLVGVSDEAVTAYRQRLIEMIRELHLDAIRVFDLDDVRPGDDQAAMRRWLIEQYGEPIEALVERTHEYAHHRELFNGIHRFLTEDLADREPGLSKNQARQRSKDDAYEVIRRSNAWSRLIAGYFPEALRLSIHPQPAHAEKIGILLTPAEDSWLTPWHGVALLQADRFVLMRRADAEALGARLIERAGRPSHYEMPAAST
jgi:pyoverdine/dityrosine biosynthesis protein Dit1